MAAHAPSQDHHPTLRHPDRVAIGAELQDVLVELIDLSLLGKQAHWNLYGPNFRSLHLHLDELVDEWREASDEVAERAVALGHPPDGQSRTVAERTELDPLPSGQIADTEVIGLLTERLTDSIGRIRTRTDRLEDVDAVTADLLHGVVMTLEKQLWMIRVQV
jgi:starvation-inducible DNA-binding protein